MAASPNYDTQVRTYPDTRAFERDVPTLTSDGWEVVQIAQRDPRSGCGWRFFGQMFIAPTRTLVVTYRKRKSP